MKVGNLVSLDSVFVADANSKEQPRVSKKEQLSPKIIDERYLLLFFLEMHQSYHKISLKVKQQANKTVFSSLAIVIVKQIYMLSSVSPSIPVTIFHYFIA